MKKYILLFAAAAVLASCSNAPKTSEAGQEAQATEGAVSLTVDAASSQLEWKGSKLAYSHNGTISIKEGTLSLENGNLTAGNFVVDMTTIKNLDITDAQKNKDLVGHLASADFFTVDSFPTSTFAITSVKALEGNPEATHEISGNLTIKGVSRQITFPAKVTLNEDKSQLTATAKFVIDRTEWGVIYGSAESIGDQAKDKIIGDEIEFNVNLVAKK